eukprot:6194569-Pleurochrysis_carterae.AAC.5
MQGYALARTRRKEKQDIKESARCGSAVSEAVKVRLCVRPSASLCEIEVGGRAGGRWPAGSKKEGREARIERERETK